MSEEVECTGLRSGSELVYVVGIGASAGALQTLVDLVHGVSLTRMALVIVQHLSPAHESLLVPLLARHAKVPVQTAHEGERVRPGRVYVIAPDAVLSIVDGVLHEAERGRASANAAIDRFFVSLARDFGASAVGVLLSGKGADGASGLEAIRAAGGIALVQEPSSAVYGEMARSALRTGVVDLCLPPAELLEELNRLDTERGAFVRPKQGATAIDDDDGLSEDAFDAPAAYEEAFGILLAMIRERFRNDLLQYKSATIQRRIARRMMIVKTSSLAEYVHHAARHPSELDALYGDLLISVTRFFRDVEPFEVLQHSFFPALLRDRDSDQPVRVWVPACATGEEAYSIAMLLCELMDDASARRVQIFATDADPGCIRVARAGRYARDLSGEVSKTRLKRFFTRRRTEYQVNRELRAMVVFAVHDLLRQPPFSGLDLVSCRNLLIYLQPEAQQRALRSLHYALKPAGGLLLGTTETVGEAPQMFSLVHRKIKLYERCSVKYRSALPLHIDPISNEHGSLRATSFPRSPVNLQSLVDDAIIKFYGPPGVVVDRAMEVLYFRGQTAPFLSPASGTASLHLFRLVEIELHMELKRCIEQTFRTGTRTVGQATCRENDDYVIVRFDCLPLSDAETQSPLVLVLFERRNLSRVASESASSDSAHVSMQGEINDLREYLQLILAEKAASTESLQMANEELQSANEELQSANEELETSKEELQSSNEELTTLNGELEVKMNELALVNDDLLNVLSGVDNVVLIVDFDLCIRRYTASAERLLKLSASDVGRSVVTLESFCGDVGIAAQAAEVIERLSPIERDVSCANGRWYAMRMVPYRTSQNAIRGVVLTLLDIDAKKRASELARDIGDYATRFLMSIGHPLLIVDAKLRVVWANDRFYAGFDLVREETVGSLLQEIEGFGAANGKVRELLLNAFEGTPFRLHALAAGAGGGRGLALSGNLIPVMGSTPLVLLSLERASESEEAPP